MLEPELIEQIQNANADGKYILLCQRLKSLRFVKDCSEENRETRLKGKPKSLIGKIYSDFKAQYSPFGNLVKAFKVPTDWPVVAMIDWHPAERQAIGFMAVDQLNRDYTVDEVWEHLGNEEIADEVIRRKQAGMRISKAYIDKLSKGDTKGNRNRWGNETSSFMIIEKRLRKHGIVLHEQSRARDSGVKIIKSKLSQPNKIPCFFVFDTCKRHQFEVKRYIYTDGKYPDTDDHFMQNWYAYAMVGLKYTPVVNAKAKYETAVAGIA